MQDEKIKHYTSKHPQWKAAIAFLIQTMRDTEMVETIKWGTPVYTVNDKNVVGIVAFKQYVGIWFYQGVFLKDVHQKLVNAQEGKTKALRQWRFESFEALQKDSSILKAYIQEAIQNQKENKVLKSDRKKEVKMPPELKDLLSKNKEVQIAFNKLSPGRQKGYKEYILEAKRASTKLSRLEKSKALILEGKGLDDLYK